MADAKQCDRCNALYATLPVQPDIRIMFYTNGFNDKRVDLCPKCQAILEKWLKGGPMNGEKCHA